MYKLINKKIPQILYTNNFRMPLNAKYLYAECVNYKCRKEKKNKHKLKCLKILNLNFKKFSEFKSKTCHEHEIKVPSYVPSSKSPPFTPHSQT